MMGREARCAWTWTPLSSSNLSFLAILLLDVCSRCRPLRFSHVVTFLLLTPPYSRPSHVRPRTDGLDASRRCHHRRCDPPTVSLVSHPYRPTAYTIPRACSPEPPSTCQRDSPRSADDDRQTVLLPNLDMSPHAGDKSGLPRRPHTPGEAADADCATTQRSPTSANACASEMSPPNTRFGRTSTHIPCASMLHAYRPGGFFALPDLRSIRPDATTRPIINSTLAVRARNVGLYSLPFPANRDHDRPLSRLSFHCER